MKVELASSLRVRPSDKRFYLLPEEKRELRMKKIFEDADKTITYSEDNLKCLELARGKRFE